MSLPEFNEYGDLPAGVYQAGWDEVIERFGWGSWQRLRCTRNLGHLRGLAMRTGHLSRFVIFGSYVTAKPDPNDVDVIVAHWQVKRNNSKRGIIEVVS